MTCVLCETCGAGLYDGQPCGNTSCTGIDELAAYNASRPGSTSYGMRLEGADAAALELFEELYDRYADDIVSRITFRHILNDLADLPFAKRTNLLHWSAGR